jgi:hypothetical protein
MKQQRLLLAIGLLAALLMVGCSQSDKARGAPPVQWQRSFQWDTAGQCVQQTRDNGYVVVGEVTHDGMYKDVFLWKTDSMGNMQWWRKYGGPKYDWAKSVRRTGDGGYFIAGHSGDSWLLRTDPQGNLLWTKKLPIRGYARRASRLQMGGVRSERRPIPGEAGAGAQARMRRRRAV